MPQPPANFRHIESLVEIVRSLRGPDGCPWDKEQSHESLTQYAIEETAELVEAIETKDSSRDAKMKEELGDVLFQVILHAQMASERGAFDFTDVIEGISEKLVRRHPHVFSDVNVTDTAEVIQNWEEIKKQEKAAKGETPKSAYALNVPPLPALQKAFKIGKRTEKLKFDWDNVEGVMVKVEEEMDELREALDSVSAAEIEHELGDVLFSLAQLGRHLKMEPEQILRKANARFEERFNLMVDLADKDGKDWGHLTLDDKESYWIKAKNILKTAKV